MEKMSHGNMHQLLISNVTASIRLTVAFSCCCEILQSELALQKNIRELTLLFFAGVAEFCVVVVFVVSLVFA